ncbi:hypothetical protein CAMRE0001_0076 [Campylobacter rectus RM3267]|uniref:Uncharacterized protein n=1 Tax=Campylobacter rectus RM3267 TaxID=553218 RepID=B9CXS1_CAMRE|nr:hypothetical protein CAMRE0001_0076 [Campylobacter rectus RM3267]
MRKFKLRAKLVIQILLILCDLWLKIREIYLNLIWCRQKFSEQI